MQRVQDILPDPHESLIQVERSGRESRVGREGSGPVDVGRIEQEVKGDGVIPRDGEGAVGEDRGEEGRHDAEHPMVEKRCSVGRGEKDRGEEKYRSESPPHMYPGGQTYSSSLGFLCPFIICTRKIRRVARKKGRGSAYLSMQFRIRRLPRRVPTALKLPSRLPLAQKFSVPTPKVISPRTNYALAPFQRERKEEKAMAPSQRGREGDGNERYSLCFGPLQKDSWSSWPFGLGRLARSYRLRRGRTT